jgi:hypothetical protein
MLKQTHMRHFFLVAILALLGLPALLAFGPSSPQAVALASGTVELPPDAMPSVLSFGAKGDGVTDDTAAIQAALNQGRRASDGSSIHDDYYGRPKALYFPPGTYLVSATLDWIGCCVTLQGAGSSRSVLKLRDAAPGFGDPAAPRAVIRTPAGNMSFRQNVRDLAINTGSDNPGAVALDYIANNSGSVTDVILRAGDGRGVRGLDLTRQWPGPALFKNLQVEGFDTGIAVAHAEYGPTFERILLRDQRVAGISNRGNTLAIRGLDSTNSVPAIVSTETWSSLILLDAELRGGASGTAAISSAGLVYARNVVAEGYRVALSVKGQDLPGLILSESISGRIFSLFDAPARSLRLPISETPAAPADPPAAWGKFTTANYGDTSRLQPLLNSGASTIYFPFGTYFSFDERIVTVPAGVRRIVGFSSVVNGDSRGRNGGGIRLIVEGNSTVPLIVEGFGYGVKLEQRGKRPVVLKHGGYDYTAVAGAGDLYLEDVELGPLSIVAGQRVWARQLNNEYGGVKIRNAGGELWILGLKTERAGTVIETTAGGRTELLGTLIYPSRPFTAAERSEPAFRSVDAAMSLIFSESVYCTGCGYTLYVEETRAGVTRQLSAAEVGGRMPLFTGFAAPVFTERIYLPLLRR